MYIHYYTGHLPRTQLKHSIASIAYYYDFMKLFYDFCFYLCQGLHCIKVPIEFSNSDLDTTD